MRNNDIPLSERDKLYPWVPKSIVPIIVVTFLILTILFFDVRGGYQTNPVIFYALPFLYLITFMSIETPRTILRTIGLYLPTLRSKIVAVVSVPLGVLLGWGLVNFSKAAPTIFPIATFPWVMSSYSTAGLGLLSNLSVTSSFFLYLVVAVFEEGTGLYLGKNAANYLYARGVKNTILACLVGLFIGRLILTSHHWFSYLGFAKPALYLSALVLFTIFTIAGIFTGMVARGFLFGEDVSTARVVPVLLPVMLAAHFAFDFFLSTLMTIS